MVLEKPFRKLPQSPSERVEKISLSQWLFVGKKMMELTNTLFNWYIQVLLRKRSL
jgi:hypothetical protein